MNLHFLDLEYLGKVWIDDIYVWYDEPLLFRCRNKFNHLFVVNCTDSSPGYAKYLFLPISKERLLRAENNEIDAYKVFTEPEENVLWTIEHNFTNKRSQVSVINKDNLTQDILPLPGHFLNDLKEKIIEDRRAEMIETARSERRDIFDISFEVEDKHDREIPAVALGNSIKELQNLLYAIAEPNSTNTQFSQATKNQHTYNVTDVYAASFGVRLKNNNLADLYGENRSSEIVEDLFNLFEVKASQEQLEALLESHGVNVSYRYKKALCTLSRSKLGFKAYYATTGQRYRSTGMTIQEINQSIAVLDSKTIEIRESKAYSGRLVAIDIKDQNFEFIEVIDNSPESVIRGELDDEISGDIFTVPLDGIAQITKVTRSNQITHDTTTKYILTYLEKNN